MMHRLLYVFSASPYSSAQGQETLDALLVGAAFEQQVSVVFVHDGVFQLKCGQNTQGSDLKQYTKTFNALEDFGVEQIYVHQPSLLARGLTIDDLLIDVQLLDSAELSNLLAQQFRVFNF